MVNGITGASCNPLHEIGAVTSKNNDIAGLQLIEDPKTQYKASVSSVGSIDSVGT